jgi:hypothetical protein
MSMNIGPELAVLYVIMLISAFTLTTSVLPFIFKERYPGKLWLAILLCVLNPGMGQFYLPGGTKFFIGLGLLFVILKQLIGSSYSWMICILSSTVIIYPRSMGKGKKP